MLRFLFPCLPYSPSTVEPMFEEQREAAQERGFETSLLSYEDLQQEDRLVVRPPALPEETLVLRGWMLKAREYQDLLGLVERRDWKMLTSMEDYARCHFMGGWLDRLEGLTPATVGLPFEEPLVTGLLANWGRVFVKDAVKSYSAEGLPIVSSWDELVALKAKMDLYRGEAESDLFYRQVEDFRADTELRLFVVRDRVYHPTAPAEALELGRQVACRIDAPFYSVDVIQRGDGAWRVVELGDGQVSDLKEWSAQQLFEIWSQLSEAGVEG